MGEEESELSTGLLARLIGNMNKGLRAVAVL
jgi:hypothetical protein